jgi:hypothetical protein
MLAAKVVAAHRSDIRREERRREAEEKARRAALQLEVGTSCKGKNSHCLLSESCQLQSESKQ